MKVALFSASTGLMLAGSAAFAGGLATPVSDVVAPIETAQPLNWTGPYAGLTLGYAFKGDDEVGIGQGNERTYTTPDKHELSGMNYGLRAGYRWQHRGGRFDWVIGTELGLEGGDVSDEFNAGGYDAESSVNNVLGLRLKSGVLNAAQDTLFYGIFGIGRVDYDYSISGTTGAAGAVNIDEDGYTSTGAIVGLGVERKFNEKWSMTGEWEYHNYGKDHLEDANGKSTEATLDWHQIKLGVNYQF